MSVMAAKTTAPAALFLGPRQIDRQCSLTQFLAVEAADRLLRVRLRAKLDKGKAFRLAGIAILDHGYRRDITCLREQFTQFVFGNRLRQIPNIQLRVHLCSP